MTPKQAIALARQQIDPHSKVPKWASPEMRFYRARNGQWMTGRYTDYSISARAFFTPHELLALPIMQEEMKK